ncbi:MAG: paraquat-inducible protein A [Oceanospirillaceae bacterium]|nr:paraquat-inducible protein A [Oceanospirillaceae bacterium]
MGNNFSRESAAEHDLATCGVCHLLNPISEDHCMRCGEPLSLRMKHSVQKTLALLITAMVFYIPANLYPIMQTTLLGQTDGNTIMSGVLLFAAEGDYFVAGVIFIASVLIPIGKMLAIYWLCYSVKYRDKLHKKELSKLYELIEFIGKWSMVDVFVVAILVALIQLGGLVSIQAGPAAATFAVMVIFTMLSAMSFDSRLIWDKLER